MKLGQNLIPILILLLQIKFFKSPKVFKSVLLIYLLWKLMKNNYLIQWSILVQPGRLYDMPNGNYKLKDLNQVGVDARMLKREMNSLCPLYHSFHLFLSLKQIQYRQISKSAVQNVKVDPNVHVPPTY